MADRATLHRNKLLDFAAWAAERGWVQEPTKGAYEVLRMRHPGKRHPFIAYDRGSPEHVSVPLTPDGKLDNWRLVQQYLRNRRAPRND